MTIHRAVALRLSQLMHKNKITQYELSKRSTIEQSTIHHILHEDTKEIKITTLIKLITSFNITIAEFFSDNIFNNIEF